MLSYIYFALFFYFIFNYIVFSLYFLSAIFLLHFDEHSTNCSSFVTKHCDSQILATISVASAILIGDDLSWIMWMFIKTKMIIQLFFSYLQVFLKFISEDSQIYILRLLSLFLLFIFFSPIYFSPKLFSLSFNHIYSLFNPFHNSNSITIVNHRWGNRLPFQLQQTPHV